MIEIFLYEFIKNYYSLSLINELLNQLNDLTIFLKIDLQNIYHKICIHKNNEWKTAFYTHYRYFEYQVMSFDLINASVIFQVYINHILQNLIDDFCIIYFNDILIFLKSEKDHYQYLKLIIKYLWHAELYTNFKKYEFFKAEVKYLDFLVNKNNLCMNLFCIKMISD